MTVLGIETATAVCGSAIVRDGRLLGEALLEIDRVHAERLLGQIEEILRVANAAPRDLEGIAVSIGPGSFTGLRIGVSVAKGLAFARGIPIIGVPTLVALVQHAVAVAPLPGGTQVLAALDARRDEVYCQLFAVAGGRVEPVWEACDLTLSALGRRLEPSPTVLTGNASEKVRAALSRSHDVHLAPAPALRCSASSVALLGEKLLESGKSDDLGTLEPHYIKDFFLKTRQ
ncbi:MAG TPA: tRNA (adenosine(37)-N6)-threonylcarbamoyltransferase complex dimerization subunit type 1 TsaB [Bacteroidota bacterium]|nr:tRNA (adenosine(37)-N6)-threonylcarbamoyltransferase complex dimerization subunit type 1 TsaB [Bacteroidota bacterium]